MGVEIPSTVVECDGCGEELNVTDAHLQIQVKAMRQVVATSEIPSESENEPPSQAVYLGTQSGRGRILKVHDFTCLSRYANADKRKGAKAKIEFHHEDEIYEPEDNRTPEELVEAGELPGAALTLNEELEDFVPRSVGGVQ